MFRFEKQKKQGKQRNRKAEKQNSKEAEKEISREKEKETEKQRSKKVGETIREPGLPSTNSGAYHQPKHETIHKIAICSITDSHPIPPGNNNNIPMPLPNL